MPTAAACEWWSGVRLASNQTDAPLERKVGPGPLGHDDEAVAKSYQPEDVEKDPEEPREEAGDLETEHVADRGSPADGRHDAVVMVAKRRERPPLDGAADVAPRAGALLHRHLRHAGQRLAILDERADVTDDEDAGMRGEGERGLRRHAADAVQRHTQRSRERRGRHAGRPEHRLGGDPLVSATGAGSRCRTPARYSISVDADDD